MGVFKRNGHWWIDYYEPTGTRRRKKIGPSKKVAELALKDIQIKMAKGEYLGIQERKSIRFKELACEYLDYSRANKAHNSFQRDKSSVNKHLVPYFEGRYLSTITTKMIQDYKTERAKQANVATVNRELSCLRHMLRIAVRWDYIKTNPMEGIKQFKEQPKVPEYLTQEEIATLLVHCPLHVHDIVAVAVNTGLRKSELLGLQWKDIDMRQRTITVQNASQGHTKNYQPRVMPMNETVYEILRRHPRHISSPYIFHNPKNTEGQPFKNIRKTLDQAAKKAGIGPISMHWFRHTFASHLVMAGVDLPTVQQLMGHQTIQMTMRYAHLAPQHLRSAVQKLHLDSHYLDTENVVHKKST